MDIGEAIRSIKQGMTLGKDILAEAENLLGFKVRLEGKEIDLNVIDKIQDRIIQFNRKEEVKFKRILAKLNGIANTLSRAVGELPAAGLVSQINLGMSLDDLTDLLEEVKSWLEDAKILLTDAETMTEDDLLSCMNMLRNLVGKYNEKAS